MAAISINFGSGGSNIASGRSGGVPTLAEALRDIADDLAGVKIAALAADASTDIAAVNASAPSAGYVQAEAVTTANLANELKTDFNALRATVVDLRTKIAAAGASYTLLTTKV